MARKPTRAELESRIKRLEPAEQAAWLLLQGHKPKRLDTGLRKMRLEIIGVHRQCGGIVITERISFIFAPDWCVLPSVQADPYLRDVVSQIHRMQREALERA